MSLRTFNFPVAATATGQDANWAQRSVGPGVVWAHNFEQPEEIRQFLFPASISQYVAQNTDPMAPYREAAPELGSAAGCAVSRTRAARILDDLPTCPALTPWTIRVDDASNFIDPATYYNGWYLLLIGYENNVPPYGGEPQEQCKVVGINYAANTLDVLRGFETPGATTDSPFFRAGTPIGTADKMRWNRLMSPFVAGQNGKTTNDQGIANGYRTKNWTWSAAAWGRYRGSYWGHEVAHAKYDQVIDPANGQRGPWPPLDNYSTGNVGATYGFTGPTATIPRLYNCFAHADANMCNEFWFQWRTKLPSIKFTQDSGGKILYVHTAHASLQQQLFIPTDTIAGHIPGAAGGTGPAIELAHRNGPTIETNGGTIMDVDVPYNHWLDQWETFMLRVKPGRSIMEWPGSPDPSFPTLGAPEGVIELYVAGPNDSAFTLIKKTSNFRFAYGLPPSFRTTPAVYNALDPCNYPNAYVSETSSSGAPLTNHAVKFAQCILSRYQIPCPPPLV